MDVSPSETRASSSPSRPLEPGGFAPGRILADRYRIVALVGRGGMGEVYRADDLKLGQPVALKFLPPNLENDPVARDRLLAEVRSARTVSHPNVCRVYDVGETGVPSTGSAGAPQVGPGQGRVFLTMEYIDGEDLASLLRRIGRLQAAKTLEIARQLCAGLAAAHHKGVLHRDLKPSNVMIDGRGQARITDFGLAVHATTAGSPADHAGTAPYLAPERFRGTPATVQSDLYGLGLILYEICTGKPAFTASSREEWERVHAESTPTNPAALATDVEPAVGQAILRCLEKDPAKRPASAAQVAAALPGGDSLAAALAAGETPSPELVAASGEEGTLPRAKAWLLLAACALGLAVAASAWQWIAMGNLVPFDGGPEVLRARARAVLRSLGYEQAPHDDAWWMLPNASQRRVLASRDSTALRFADAARILPTPLLFTYRQSPADLRPFDAAGVVLFNNPPPQTPNDALVRIDTLGRLVYLRVVPPTREPDPRAVREPDWHPLLAAAGLPDESLTSVVPQLVPPVAFDARQAWTGMLGGDTFRFEAASFRGRIVFAQWLGGGDNAVGESAGGSALSRYATAVVAMVWLFILALVVVIARHNVRLGRGDRRGARRVAAFVLAVSLAVDLARRHWVPDVAWVWDVISTRLGPSLFWAAFVWLAYLALEPFARRAWPHLLIGWTRLLDARWRDPLVGQSLLAGVLAGTLIAAISSLPETGGRFLGLAGTEPVVNYYALYQANYFIAYVGSAIVDGAVATLALVAFMVIVRFALRAERAVVMVTVVLVAFFEMKQVRPVALDVAQAVILGILCVAFLRRYGLLAFATASAVGSFVLKTPWTFDVTKWFAWRPMMTVVLVMAVAVWGFRNVLGKQSAFPGEVLDG